MNRGLPTERMDILTAIRKRVSVRGYTGQQVEPASLDALLRFARTTHHLTATPPRIELISGVALTKEVLTFIIGSYGLVQNAPHLLVGVLPEDGDLPRLDLGYVLEQVVLEATRMGLGTVWVTGTFDPRRAAQLVGAHGTEVVAAVCALGYPAEHGLRRLHNEWVRRLAGAGQRKPLSEMACEDRWGKPWSVKEAAPSLIALLECARLAPSAMNRQPWRFVVRETEIALATAWRAPIDAGIVMAHIALAAPVLGYEGRWEIRWGDTVLREEYGFPLRAVPVGIFRFR